MVIAQVVRIRNETKRTFTLRPGDPCYKVQLEGQDARDGQFLIGPGFDQAVSGLVIPWEIMTSGGLEVEEVLQNGPEQVVRCIIGAVERDGLTRDWLQMRSITWEPIEQDKWLHLGRRHLFGTVGSAVDIHMIFRDSCASGADRPPQLARVLHFDHAVRCAPSDAVILNVFDLVSAAQIPNAILNNTVFHTFGAFHAAVEIYGEEWSFYRTTNAKMSGVFRSPTPRQHAVHIYRQSIIMGTTTLRDWEVRYLIRGQLAPQWPGGSYNLLRRNCIHFCDELLLYLGVSPIPSWVKGLHEVGACVLRVPWPLSCFFSEDVSSGRRALPGNNADGYDSALEAGEGKAKNGAASDSDEDPKGHRKPEMAKQDKFKLRRAPSPCPSQGT